MQAHFVLCRGSSVGVQGYCSLLFQRGGDPRKVLLFIVRRWRNLDLKSFIPVDGCEWPKIHRNLRTDLTLTYAK